MSRNPRATLRHDEPSTQLLDRLHSQFPELSRDEVRHAAAGVIALPSPDPVEATVVVTTPPRHRA